MSQKHNFKSLTKHQKRLIIMILLALIGIGSYMNEQRREALDGEISERSVMTPVVSPKGSPSGGQGAVMRAMPEEKKLPDPVPVDPDSP